MKIPTGYGFADVVVLTDATRSNLIYWTNIGLIKADIQAAGGPGRHRRFSAFNVIEVQLAATASRFRLSTHDTQGVLEAFRRFHLGCIAVWEELHDAPLSTDLAVGPIFLSHEQRTDMANSFVEKHLPFAPTDAHREQTFKRVVTMAEAWTWILSGPLMRGEPVHPRDRPSSFRFLGLFLGGLDDYGEFAYPQIELDPVDLDLFVEGSAVVINLGSTVFRVGEHCKKLGGWKLTPWTSGRRETAE